MPSRSFVRLFVRLYVRPGRFTGQQPRRTFVRVTGKVGGFVCKQSAVEARRRSSAEVRGDGVGKRRRKKEIAMVVVAPIRERRKDDENRRREGARTFSLRGLCNLRLRACRSSERCGNDLLDPLSLSCGAVRDRGRFVDVLGVVIVQVHNPTPKQDGHVPCSSFVSLIREEKKD